MKHQLKPQFFFRGGLCGVLLALFGGHLSAQDAGLIVVYKQQRFEQSIAATPTLQEAGGPVSFAALVEPTTPVSILSASVDLAGGGNQPLTYIGDDEQFIFERRFDRFNDLQAAYPDGNYTFRISTQNDGPQVLTVNLSGDLWPSAPRIANLPSFQGFNPAQPFTLQWDPLTGGTANDVILVSIYSQSSGNSFDSPGPGEPGALDGTDTSIQIPGGTFGAGETLEAEINFARIADANTTYGVAYAVYLKVTDFAGATTGGTDLQAPVLVESAPRSGQPGVDRGSVISFTFSEAMRPGVTIGWTGVGAAAFTYTWSPDRLTLFCSHGTGLPANTVIGWTLNPVSSPANLRDLAGNPVAPLQGGFATSDAAPTGGPDVGLFLLAKGRMHTQTGSVVDPLDRVVIIVDGQFKALNAVTNGVYTLPNTRTAPVLFSYDHSSLESEAAFVEQADLDRFFGSGDYTISLNTVHDGTQTAVLTLTGDAYPNTPTINNLAAGQAIDAASSYALNWQPFVGGSANDYVLVEIENQYGESAYQSPDLGQPGALNGTATGVTLAAGTLGPGRSYSAQVIFFRPVDVELAAYPGATLVAGYFAMTEFPLTTTGSVTGPTLSVLPPVGSEFRLQLAGEAGIPYRVEVTGNFSGWDYFSQVFVDPGSGTTVLSDPSLALPDVQRFFRAREGY